MNRNYRGSTLFWKWNHLCLLWCSKELNWFIGAQNLRVYHLNIKSVSKKNARSLFIYKLSSPLKWSWLFISLLLTLGIGSSHHEKINICELCLWTNCIERIEPDWTRPPVQELQTKRNQTYTRPNLAFRAYTANKTYISVKRRWT